MKRLELFTYGTPLLPVDELVEAHRSPGLVLSPYTRHGSCGILSLSDGHHGGDLVTETLRLASIGRRYLEAIRREPGLRLYELGRDLVPADAELLIHLEGR